MSYQHVVWLDVAVKHSAVSQMLQCHEKLQGVGTHGCKADPNIAPKLLQNLPQIHTQRFEHEAQVALHLEAGEEQHAVAPVLRISSQQLPQNHQFLLTSLVPGTARVQ